MYYGFDPTILLLIPAMIFTLWAQAKVKSAYATYSKIKCKRNISGMEAAKIILGSNQMRNMPINQINGQLTDHYNPKDKTMNLSHDVYAGNSIAAIAIAAHEAGHAIQDHEKYDLLRFRNTIVPIVNLTSYASWPLIIIGLLLVAASQTSIGHILLNLGIIFFSLVVLFHALTLPVELDASKKAINQLISHNLIDQTEVKGAKKVLTAAALTYVAALASALMSLLRIIIIARRN